MTLIVDEGVQDIAGNKSINNNPLCPLVVSMSPKPR